MKKNITSWAQQIDIQLKDQYAITKPTNFEIGQSFGLQNVGNIKGLRIANGNELNAAFSTQSGATLMQSAQLECLTISLYNAREKELTVQNLPLMALVIDPATEPHAGPYYELDFPIDWTKSQLTVVQGVAALVTPNFYMLSIVVYF